TAPSSARSPGWRAPPSSPRSRASANRAHDFCGWQWACPQPQPSLPAEVGEATRHAWLQYFSPGFTLQLQPGFAHVFAMLETVGPRGARSIPCHSRRGRQRRNLELGADLLERARHVRPEIPVVADVHVARGAAAERDHQLIDVELADLGLGDRRDLQAEMELR